MKPDRAKLESLGRDDLIALARRTGVKRAEVMTRVELVDEVLRLETPNPTERRKVRGWLGVARDLVASLVEQGLHLPDAAALIRGDVRFEPIRPPQPPVATVTLAEIYGAQGHYDRALTILDEVLGKEPDHQVARKLRDRLAEERGGRRAAPQPAPSDVEPGSGDTPDTDEHAPYGEPSAAHAAEPERDTDEPPAERDPHARDADEPSPDTTRHDPSDRDPMGVLHTLAPPARAHSDDPDPMGVLRTLAPPPREPPVDPDPMGVLRTLPPPAPPAAAPPTLVVSEREPPTEARPPLAVFSRRGSTCTIYFDWGFARANGAARIVRVVEMRPGPSGTERVERDVEAAAHRGTAGVTGIAPNSVVRVAVGVLENGAFRAAAVAAEVGFAGEEPRVLWAPRKGLDSRALLQAAEVLRAPPS